VSRRVTWVLLCEDEQHYAFARRFLKLMTRPEMRECRKVLGPGHSGVSKRLAEEIRVIRAQGARAGLLVILDADGHSSEERRRDALRRCTEEERPRSSDPVAILLPARNIETWIAWLEGQSVDSVTKYPKLERERDCQAAVERLKGHCDSGLALPAGCPPSLIEACTEFRRVLGLLRA
jgi:hypothetical protein